MYDETNCCGTDYYLTEAECVSGQWMVMAMDPAVCSVADACSNETDTYTTVTTGSVKTVGTSATNSTMFGDDEKEAFCEGLENVLELTTSDTVMLGLTIVIPSGMLASCVVDAVVDPNGRRRQDSTEAQVDFTVTVTAAEDFETGFNNGLEQAQFVHWALKTALVNGDLETQVNKALANKGSDLVVDFDVASLEAQTRLMSPPEEVGSADDSSKAGVPGGLVAGAVIAALAVICVALAATYKCHVAKKRETTDRKGELTMRTEAGPGYTDRSRFTRSYSTPIYEGEEGVPSFRRKESTREGALERAWKSGPLDLADRTSLTPEGCVASGLWRPKVGVTQRTAGSLLRPESNLSVISDVTDTDTDTTILTPSQRPSQVILTPSQRPSQIVKRKKALVKQESNLSIISLKMGDTATTCL